MWPMGKWGRGVQFEVQESLVIGYSGVGWAVQLATLASLLLP